VKHISSHSEFPKTSQPAQRALTNAGYTKLEQLANVSEKELGKLHGVGPRALRILKEALEEEGLSFKQ
jgi:DNA-directed RNA polymerase alpha subunit